MPGIISNKGFLGPPDNAIFYRKERLGSPHVADLTASKGAKDRIGLILNASNDCAYL